MSMVVIGKTFKDVGFALSTVEGDGLKRSRDSVTGRTPKETEFLQLFDFVDSVLLIRDSRISLRSS